MGSDYWEQRQISRPNDMQIAKYFGWTITRETIEYDSDTREHDCATYPGDKIYGGQKYDAWVIRHNGERKGWVYGRDETDEGACAVLCDFVGMPQYTTDINAALEYLVLPEGCYWSLIYKIPTGAGELCSARIYHVNPGYMEDMVMGWTCKNLPTAICEAYKKWKEMD